MHLITSLVVCALLTAACSKTEQLQPKVDPADNWVWLGRGGVDLHKVPYRLMDGPDGHGGRVPATNKDILALTLDLQSGRGVKEMVYLPAYDCYGPAVLEGLPTVRCDTKGGKVEVVASDNVREILLALGSDKKRAAVVGKALGIMGIDSPVILVVDVTAKRDSN